MEIDGYNDDYNESDPEIDEATSTEHPLKAMLPKKKDFDLPQVLEDCKDYLMNELATRNCITLGNYARTQCKCLSFIGDVETEESEILEIARYMVDWKKKTGTEQKQLLSAWNRTSPLLQPTHLTRSFVLQVLPEGGGTSTQQIRMICWNAVAAVF